MPHPRKTARKKTARPVIVSRNSVRCRGDRLSRPLLWQGRQWAVTGYGVEARDGSYPIRKERLAEATWDEHMAEKRWVDMADFRAALAWARDYYDVATPTVGEAPEPRAADGSADTPARPTPGVFHLIDGQVYRHLSEFEVEAKNRKYLFFRLLGKCAACGAAFRVDAPLEGFDDGLPKHCDTCQPTPLGSKWMSESTVAGVMA